MVKMANHLLLMFYSLFIVFALQKNAAAAVRYYVGDNLGWTIPPNISFYSEWTNSKTFQIGDTVGKYYMIPMGYNHTFIVNCFVLKWHIICKYFSRWDSSFVHVWLFGCKFAISYFEVTKSLFNFAFLKSSFRKKKKILITRYVFYF